MGLLGHCYCCMFIPGMHLMGANDSIGRSHLCLVLLPRHRNPPPHSHQEEASTPAKGNGQREPLLRLRQREEAHQAGIRTRHRPPDEDALHSHPRLLPLLIRCSCLRHSLSHVQYIHLCLRSTIRLRSRHHRPLISPYRYRYAHWNHLLGRSCGCDHQVANRQERMYCA